MRHVLLLCLLLHLAQVRYISNLYGLEVCGIGNLSLLSAATHDIVHEPYRQKLIPNFEIVQQIVKEDTDGILLISGSGSTCLCIAKKELSTAARLKIASLPHHWQCLQLDVAYHGTEIER